MLRLCSCVIALAVMLVGLPTAQAADTTLTLACKGSTLTSTIGATDQPTLELTSFGVIANLTAQTIEGFPVADLPIKITAANQATIQFDGSETIFRPS